MPPSPQAQKAENQSHFFQGIAKNCFFMAVI